MHDTAAPCSVRGLPVTFQPAGHIRIAAKAGHKIFKNQCTFRVSLKDTGVHFWRYLAHQIVTVTCAPVPLMAVQFARTNFQPALMLKPSVLVPVVTVVASVSENVPATTQ